MLEILFIFIRLLFIFLSLKLFKRRSKSSNSRRAIQFYLLKSKFTRRARGNKKEIDKKRPLSPKNSGKSTRSCKTSPDVGSVTITRGN